VAQTRHWRNNETLFRHAVSVSTNNTIAQYNLGLTLQQQGRWSEAAQHYYQAIQSNPRWEPAYNNLGFIFNQPVSLTSPPISSSKASK